MTVSINHSFRRHCGSGCQGCKVEVMNTLSRAGRLRRFVSPEWVMATWYRLNSMPPCPMVDSGICFDDLLCIVEVVSSGLKPPLTKACPAFP